MPTISPDLHTVIIRFKIAPERAELLIAGVRSELERWVSHLPGFISSTFHRSGDGAHVINYAQWTSAAAYDEFLAHAEHPRLIEAITEAAPERAEGDAFEVLFTVGSGG